MIAKTGFLILCALGAGMGAANATHVGSKAHVSVAEIQPGDRLSGQADTHVDEPKHHVDEASAEPASPPARSERKVRVVYPLLR